MTQYLGLRSLHPRADPRLSLPNNRLRILNSPCSSMGFFGNRVEWEILDVTRSPSQTHVLARHLKTGRAVEMIRGPDYAPRVDELKRSLRMELENRTDPSFAEYRRRSLDKLPGVRI